MSAWLIIGELSVACLVVSFFAALIVDNARTPEQENRRRAFRRWFGWIGLALLALAIVLLLIAKWETIQKNLNKKADAVVLIHESTG